LGFLREFIGTILFGLAWICVIFFAIAGFFFAISGTFAGAAIMFVGIAVIWGLSKVFRKAWPERKVSMAGPEA